MHQHLDSSYNSSLVGLSYLIAVVASYLALELSSQVRSSSKMQQWLWLTGGAVAMGTGIWAMHFIAMLAFHLPIPVQYDLAITALSWLCGVGASGVALGLLSRADRHPALILACGLVMGGAIASMHYMGMAAMRTSATIEYRVPFVVLSIAIAIAASFAALWLSIETQKYKSWQALLKKVGSAVVMGIAISGMHYTGMWATDFVPNDTGIFFDDATLSEPFWLAITIGIGTLLMLVLVLVAALFNEQVMLQKIREQALAESEARVHNLIRDMQVGVLLLDAEARILFSNQAACQLLQLNCLSNDLNNSLRLSNEPCEPLESQVDEDNLSFDTNTEQVTMQIFGDRPQFVQADGTPFLTNDLPVQRAIATLTPARNVVMGIQQADHNYQWLLVNAEPRLDDSGHLSQVVCTVNNITTEKYAEQALWQQMKIAALRVAVGSALNEGITLREMLQRCAEALHQKLDVAFARIWVFDDADQVLILKASAGLYTHVNGGHSRIAIGQFKIGTIAAKRIPHLTNDLANDPLISNPDWAVREGMQAFAGYPLIVQSRLVGVMAAFSYHPLDQSTLDEMQAVATTIAVGIARKQADGALQESAMREKAIARVIQRMRQTLDIKDIFTAATYELRQVIGCDRVVVYRFNPDWSGAIIAESVNPSWLPIIAEADDAPKIKDLPDHLVNNANCLIQLSGNSDGRIEDTYLQNFEGGKFHQKKFYRAVSDIYQENFSECYIRFLEKIQANAYLIAPIHRGKSLWGLLVTFHNASSHPWQPSEVAIVTQISEQLGVAVQQAELFTQIQQQAIELQKAKEAADAANLAKSEFLANMSHELRTPLNAILGFTQLMSLDSAISKDQKKYLETIGRSGEHLLGLINDVLEMSKIEAGRMALDYNTFNLYELIGTIEDMLRYKAESKGLQLSIECTPDLPIMICSDEGKLRQILINLLNNAIKFTDQGKIWLRASIASDESATSHLVGSSNPSNASPLLPAVDTDTSKTYIQFEVEDTGCGIPESQYDTIFSAFGQAATDTRPIEGTGLGLTISQQFARLMGGLITVESNIHQGSLFTVVMPVQISPYQSKISLPSSFDLNTVKIAPGQPDYRILMVEDDPTNRELLGQILTSLGLTYREAEDGQQALEIWQTWKPHFIWMDIQIPKINGLEVIKTIKTTSQGKETIIVALTASAFEEQKQRIMAAGCDDFLHKPFKIEALLTKMTKHLGLQYCSTDNHQLQLDQQQIGQEILQKNSNQFFDIRDIECMSLEWRKQLYQASARGSDQHASELIKAIPSQYSTLADHLQTMIDNFQFDKLMKLMTTETIYSHSPD